MIATAHLTSNHMKNNISELKIKQCNQNTLQNKLQFNWNTDIEPFHKR